MDLATTIANADPAGVVVDPAGGTPDPPGGTIADGSSTTDGGRAHTSGRPRDELREQAILDAAMVLLGEVGYDRLSIDTLAGRAHASKATIYRRWPGKAAVVADAVRRMKCAEGLAVPDTGTLRGDLVELFVSSVAEEDAAAHAAILAGLVRAMRDDPELDELMRTRVFGDRHEVVELLVARAIERGELPPTADAPAVVEIVQAVVLARLAFEGEPLDVDFAIHLIDDIALPLLRR